MYMRTHHTETQEEAKVAWNTRKESKMATANKQRETTRVLNYLASTGDLARVTVTNKVADEIMLNTSATLMAKGYIYNIKSKRVSPGVCLLTLARAN